MYMESQPNSIETPTPNMVLLLFEKELVFPF